MMSAMLFQQKAAAEKANFVKDYFFHRFLKTLDQMCKFQLIIWI